MYNNFFEIFKKTEFFFYSIPVQKNSKCETLITFVVSGTRQQSTIFSSTVITPEEDLKRTDSHTVVSPPSPIGAAEKGPVMTTNAMDGSRSFVHCTGGMFVLLVVSKNVRLFL